MKFRSLCRGLASGRLDSGRRAGSRLAVTLLVLTLSLTNTAEAEITAAAWEPVGLPFSERGITPQGLELHPHGDHHRFFMLDLSALWQVDNAGTRWEGVIAPPYRDLDFPPTAENSRAFAVDLTDPAHLHWIVGNRILTTHDHGRHWNSFRFFGAIYIQEAHIHPKHPEWAYVVGSLSEDAISAPYSYRSLDGGSTWSAWNVPGVFSNHLLRFAPDDPDHFYTAGEGLYHSVDAGETWETLLGYDIDSGSPTIYDLAFAGPDGETLYLIADDTLLESSNGGQSFEPVAGAQNLVPRQLEADPRNRHVLFVRDWNGRVHGSDDGGATFTELTSDVFPGSKVLQIRLEPRYGEHLYAYTEDQLYRLDTNPVSVRDCHRCDGIHGITTAGSSSIPVDAPNQPSRDLASRIAAEAAAAPSIRSPLDSHLAPSASEAAGWHSLGPEGGALHQLAVCPSQNETVYAAARHHIFVSLDSAQTWKLAGVLPVGEVDDIYCDAQDSERLYVDAGRVGILRSDDGGATWVLMGGLVEPPAVPLFQVHEHRPEPQRLAVHPRLGDHLYLALGDVFHSDDGGNTWQRVYQGDPGFCHLLIPRADDTTLYARPCALEKPVWQRQYGLWRSTDGGSSWQQQSSEPIGPELFDDPQEIDRLSAIGFTDPRLETFDTERWYPRGQGLPQVRLRALAANPLDPAVRLAISADELFRSSDDGATYEPVTDPDLQSPDLYGPYIQGARLRDLVYAPGTTAQGTGPRAYLATDTGLLWTRGGGVQWHPRNSGLAAWSVEQLTAHPSIPGYLLLVAGGHGWRSLDGGVTWTLLDEPSAGITTSLGVAPSDAQTLYAGSRDGIWHSDDQGASWQETQDIPAFEPQSFAVDPSQPDVVYVAGTYFLDDEFPTAVLYQSQDAGASWQHVRVTFQGPTFHRVLFDPRDDERVYVAGPGLFRSSASGWQEITGWTFAEGPTVLDLAFDPTRSDTFFVATAELGVLRGGSTGETAPLPNQGLPSEPVQAVTVDADGALYAGLERGMYKSTDAGASWQPVHGAFDPLARGITALIRDASGKLFAGTVDHGVHGRN